jgi:hypothetical protein
MSMSRGVVLHSKHGGLPLAASHLAGVCHLWSRDVSGCGGSLLHVVMEMVCARERGWWRTGLRPSELPSHMYTKSCIQPQSLGPLARVCPWVLPVSQGPLPPPAILCRHTMLARHRPDSGGACAAPPPLVLGGVGLYNTATPMTTSTLYAGRGGYGADTHTHAKKNRRAHAAAAAAHARAHTHAGGRQAGKGTRSHACTHPAPQRRVVWAILLVVRYGSALDAGRRSSR